MFNITYNGLRIIVSDAAMRELFKEYKTLLDVQKILVEGYVSPRRRGRDKIEMWFDKGNKTYEAVIVKDHNRFLNEDVWVLIHFGKFGRKER